MTHDRPRFALGRVVATPGALAAIEECGHSLLAYICRHQVGDWGNVGPEDWAENELSLRQGLRLLSAYNLPSGKRLWVITEADRSVTTALLPREY